MTSTPSVPQYMPSICQNIDISRHVLVYRYIHDRASRCWRYALEAIMYDDICYVFMNKDSPWTLSMMCISKYVTCLWDYALYDDCPKRSLVERAVCTRSRLD